MGAHNMASPYLGVTLVKKLVKRAKTASKPEFKVKIAIFKSLCRVFFYYKRFPIQSCGDYNLKPHAQTKILDRVHIRGQNSQKPYFGAKKPWFWHKNGIFWPPKRMAQTVSNMAWVFSNRTLLVGMKKIPKFDKNNHPPTQWLPVWSQPQ